MTKISPSSFTMLPAVKPDTPCFHQEGCQEPCLAWRVCWQGGAPWSSLKRLCETKYWGER